VVRGRYTDPREPGEVNHFQALTTALSGTVGLGNIAGVAVAVSIGGAGATFWMILAGLLGMASKFTECTLGVKYRNEYPDGTVSGGPMYYLSKGFAERGLPLGGFMAFMFAICCVLGALGGGNMFQANQAASQVESVLGVPTWVTGLVLAGIVFAVIIGGIKSIARVTEKVVPFMGAGYFLTGLSILIGHHDMIGWAIGEICAAPSPTPASRAASSARSSRAFAAPRSRTRRASARPRSPIRRCARRSRSARGSWRFLSRSSTRW
jgi:alanine or glycine:cation symporter, AGCS family